MTETISLLSGKTILDCIEIRTSRIEMYRSSLSTVCSVQGPGEGCAERRSTILEPMEFVARINRNISQPSEAYPNVDVLLELDAIKVCVLVCVCVCVCVCVYVVCVCVCVCWCVCVGVCVLVCVCWCVCACVCAHMHVCVRVYVECVCVCVYGFGWPS